jgi:hypothetical protein
VSEDIQWRQLGTVVNGVLQSARLNAIRTGRIMSPPASAIPGKIALLPRGLAADRARSGPVKNQRQAALQLDLPFGIGGAGLGTIRSAQRI